MCYLCDVSIFSADSMIFAYFCCALIPLFRKGHLPASTCRVLRMAVAGSEKKDAIQLVTVTVRTLNGSEAEF